MDFMEKKGLLLLNIDEVNFWNHSCMTGFA